ncbi:glycosyltransferase [Halonotius terrestris]|uniref:Glycosyltransferase n=1 Tax=Halonotius terrestris TaxID=2487750 RepID=A0A8J8PDB2_9EURY|nr:glycosyltransferase [Halonotius terrestris]TQQ83271.1 glycosyltransferase [Halonotius terrestris]
MRIGFFTDSYFPGIDGVTYTIKTWRERLESRGHEVSIVYPDSSHEPGPHEYPVPSLPNPFYEPYRMPVYRRLSSLPDLDVVHCHGPATTGLMGRQYAARNGLRSVYTHHTPIEDYLIQALKFDRLADLAGRAYVAYETRFLRSFDAVTASTSKIRRDVAHEKLPVGVDLETFQPQGESLFDGPRPVVGYSGRLTRKKNVDEILRVAAETPKFRYVIVGEGPDRPRLEATAPDNVEFRDFLPREQLPTFYSSLDAFVTASTCDTLGLSTLEANACGTPVAAADVQPFTETITDDNGARFAYGDLTEMQAAITDCLHGDRPTRAAVERFSVERTIDKLEAIYRDERVPDTSEQPIPLST